MTTQTYYNREYFRERRNQILGAHGFSPSDDPSRWLQEFIDLLAKMPGTDGDSDYGPLTQVWPAHDLSSLYGEIAEEFTKRRFFSAAETLFIAGWNHFGQVQLEKGERVYRAAIGNRLSTFYERIGDRGAAIRWALYTQADDLLGEHEEGGGDARKKLAVMWGMKPDALDALHRIAAENVATIRSDYLGDWSQAPGFAEDVVRRFALEKPQFAHLFAEGSALQEFALSRPYFSALLRRVNAHYAKGQEKEKGSALEDLASYLFLLIPGWVPRRNLVDLFDTGETDLVVRNLNPVGNLTAELLGRHFLVECKNWDSRVGVKEVGYFLYRMRLSHAEFGLMLAQGDVTGDEIIEDAARGLIRKAFHEDGNVCIVMTQHDFEALVTGQVSLWPLLLERIEAVRFGQPQGS